MIAVSKARFIGRSMFAYEASVTLNQAEAAQLDTLSKWFGDNHAEIFRLAIEKGMKELNGMMEQAIDAEREAEE